jgi:TM2 domain-containing membrane protein YozV
MNCAVHTDTPATAFCRTCGKALCENCKRDVMGAIYCEPCIAARLHGAPAATVQGAAAAPGVIPVAAQTPSGAPSPAIAMLLGFIPGVGAMYNGQFVKAFVHVVIFVLLIAAANNISDAFGFAIAFFVFYMAFDAYKTAQAKLLGLPLPDPLGIDRIFGIQEHGPQPTRPAVVAPTTTASAAVPPAANVPSMSAPADAQVVAPPPPQEATPTGAIVLIALGVLFLLGNFGMFSMHRLWPLFLIGLGLWIAYRRTMERC